MLLQFPTISDTCLIASLTCPIVLPTSAARLRAALNHLHRRTDQLLDLLRGGGRTLR